MYLEVKGESIEAITEAFDDIKYTLENQEYTSSGVYFGEVVAWKLNVNQR